MLAFDWYRDSLGYELHELPRKAHSQKPNPKKPQSLLAIDTGGSVVVRRLGGKLERYQPLEIDVLYRILSECPKTPDGVLNFIKRFGMPDDAKGNTYLPYELYRYIDGLEGANTLYDEENWTGLATAFDTAWQKSRSGIGETAIQLIYSDEMDRPEFRMRPRSLIAAIHIQFAIDISGGIKTKMCRWCSKWFKYGPGTAHRSNARYCSRRCLNAESYRKRKKNGAGA